MLIHFTSSVEALNSILVNGLLYLHNETGVLGPAFKNIFDIEQAEDQSNGMICFTELGPNKTINHQSTFGSFGVGISKEWLISHNAQKVEYVEIGGDTYNTIITKLKLLTPSTLRGIPLNELLENPKTRFEAITALTGRMTTVDDLKANPEYFKIFRYLMFTQTDKDMAQMEWRIQNPNPQRFMGKPTQKQKIELLLSSITNNNLQNNVNGLAITTIGDDVSLASTGKLSLVFPIPKEKINALFCPENYVEMFKSALGKAGLASIPIYSSSND